MHRILFGGKASTVFCFLRYPTRGECVDRSFWGPVYCVNHKGRPLAIKVINLRRLNNHRKTTHSSCNDDVYNEVTLDNPKWKMIFRKQAKNQNDTGLSLSKVHA